MKTSANYINFARKYRPNNLREIVGQKHLVTILNYSIIHNKLAQGYLLTGIRGTGKTTSARIIAKTVNCSSTLIVDDIVNPCEQCQNCQSFNNHRHPDIIEMDAASKTSVDDIREIIEHSEYKPLLGQYKIFIIDEIHMLSRNAFNALLKVIEEPPLHIIFIFATTEVHKIPLTVISRCQRYDLKRLAIDEIIHLLQTIAKKESITIESAALQLIAARSEGSAREAVALLDQINSFRAVNEDDSLITANIVSQILGIVDTATVIKLFGYIVANDGVKIIKLINEIYQSSTSLENLILSISDFIAYVSKIKISGDYHLSEYSYYQNEITNISIITDEGRLSVLWQIFYKGLDEIKNSSNQLVSCEMLFLKATYSHTLSILEPMADSVSVPTISTVLTTKNIDNQQPSETKKFDLKSDNEYKFTDFLTFLNTQDMDLYYQLFNNYEVKRFEHCSFEIVGLDINLKTKDQIASLLLKWSNKKWNVVISKDSSITSLKKQLINKVESSEEWTIVKNFFQSASISDILMKNKRN
ncbi:MAG: DNA polymerase III subunit gamma/tau [Rickettsiaceae bacterium]|nr:MAG: DNA polymerase III subunit gamma/tau [Rickettsiaceae bacterium]